MQCRCILSLRFMSCKRRVRDGVSPQPGSGTPGADLEPGLFSCPVLLPAQLLRNRSLLVYGHSAGALPGHCAGISLHTVTKKGQFPTQVL